MLRPASRPAALQVFGLAAFAALSAMAGCGGAEPGSIAMPSNALAQSAPPAAAPAPAPAPAPSLAASAAAPAVHSAPSASLTHGSGTYGLRLYGEDGRAASSFELRPVEGRGYPAVRVRIVLRGPQVFSPVAEVQPFCLTTARCDYLPPRNGNLAMKYSVSIPADSIAQLSPAKDMVAITTRNLSVPEATDVVVTLKVEGQDPVTARIKYLRSPE